jgi:hypothetical protein
MPPNFLAQAAQVGHCRDPPLSPARPLARLFLVTIHGQRLTTCGCRCAWGQDVATCDVLVVLGTSLQVQPFAGVVDLVRPRTPRLLINRERVGTSRDGGRTGLVFGPGSWDVYWEGACDAGATRLAELLGLRDALASACAAAGRTLPP